MKNLLSLFFPFLICPLSFLTTLNACSCIGIPETFLKDTKKDQLVIHVKIIEHEGPGEIFQSMNTGTSKLKVINVLSGNLEDDIVYFVSGEGAACRANIQGLEIGEEMILKPGIFTREKDKNKIFLHGSICSRWMQPIKDGRVVGNVTKNKMSKRYRKIKKLREKGDEKSLKRLDKLYKKPVKSQRIRIRKLKKKLSRVTI